MALSCSLTFFNSCLMIGKRKNMSRVWYLLYNDFDPSKNMLSTAQISLKKRLLAKNEIEARIEGCQKIATLLMSKGMFKASDNIGYPNSFKIVLEINITGLNPSG